MTKETQPTPCPTCGESHEGEEGHHCPDWDFLFVRNDSPEMEACLCQTKQTTLPFYPEEHQAAHKIESKILELYGSIDTEMMYRTLRAAKALSYFVVERK